MLLPGLLCILLVHGAEHLQAHHGCSILTQYDIVNLIRLLLLIDEQRTQTLSRDIDGRDDGLIALYCILREA